MSSKIKLTPKDVLYISDVLNQFSAYNADDLDAVKDKTLKQSMQCISEGFSEQFETFKKILKEASR